MAKAKIKSLAEEVEISSDASIKGSRMLSSAKAFLRYTPVEALGQVMLEDGSAKADKVTLSQKQFCA